MTQTIPKSNHPSRWSGRQLVKTQFQLKFSMAVFVLITFFMLLSWYLGNQYVEHLASSGLIPKNEVGIHMKVLVNVMVRSSLLSWIVAFGISIFFSHFVAGPIYRFERIMREVQGGNLIHRVKIRPYDELQDLAREMDEALSQIRTRAGMELARRQRLMIELERMAGQARSAGLEADALIAEQILSEEKNRPPEFMLPVTPI